MKYTTKAAEKSTVKITLKFDGELSTRLTFKREADLQLTDSVKAKHLET